jgi:hypothetical protein
MLCPACIQVSGYIDYAHRLKVDPNMEAYFDRSKRLMPQHSDLSFYNWETHLSTSNPTPNFQVCSDSIDTGEGFANLYAASGEFTCSSMC